MIIVIFLIGFILGLVSTLIGEKLPLILPEVTKRNENSWILNLFIAIVNSVIAVIAYHEYGFDYEFFVSLIISCLVINIFVSDIKYMIILDSPLVISGILILVLRTCFYGFKNAGISLLSGLALFGFMIIIGLLGKKIFKKESLGGGDIKLAAIIGITLNIRLGLIAIIFSSLLALPYALAAILLNKDNEVPYGPFLVGSMALVFMFYDKFTNLINLLG